MFKWTRLLAVLLAVTLGFGTVGIAVAAEDWHKKGKLQLIAEQATATAGGKVNYHIIYHNKEEEDQSNIQLEVRLHPWMEVADAGGGAWDEKERTLRWNIGYIAENGAYALHFQVKMKEEAQRGSDSELHAVVKWADGSLWRTPPVRVRIDSATHQPFMQGYPDGTFRPDGELTRAETAAMIARIYGLKPVRTQDYADVPASHWAHNYIRQMRVEGYMVGYGNEFRPDEPITKAELLTLMLRLHGVEEMPFDVPYGDMKDHWSRYALGTAHELGYIKEGDSDGESPLFAPDLPIERKVAAMWLSIGMLRGPLADGGTKVERHFSDVHESHPYFGWIAEASSVAHESEQRGDGAERLIRYLPELTNPF